MRPTAWVAPLCAGLCVGIGSLSAAPFDTLSRRAAPDREQARTFDSSRAWGDLREIVSLGPRPAGSVALRNTRTYIRRQLEAIGLTVDEQAFDASTPLGTIAMVNLRVTLPGRRATRILLTGHYDTKLFRDFAFVGANDGGSSAALLIELVRALKDTPREFTYEFVWFDGEEAVIEWVGLDHTYGSRHYVEREQRSNTLDSIAAMILVDMIGGRGLEVKRELNSSSWLNDIVWEAAGRLGLTTTFVDQTTVVEDDHIPFLAAGVPAIDLIGFDHYREHWHQPTDDLSNVSARSLQAVGDVLITALPAIERYLAQRE